MMKKLFLIALAFSLVLLASTRTWALEREDGRIKLILHEGTGRFSIYYLKSFKEKQYVSFLVDKDPRTSVVSVLIGNNIYRLGETSKFQEKVEKTVQGARFVWVSNLLQVTEDFAFITSNGSPLTDGVKITFQLKNTSEQDLTVGLRVLFDTYLGEDSYVHFKTDQVSEITHETTILKGNMVKYWISPLVGDSDNFGLQVLTNAKGITTPDRVVFANWKRLNDSSWLYETSTSRNFNLLPYSINDSAVCQYYDPLKLEKGETRSIVLLLGKYDPEGWDLSGEKTGVSLNKLLKKTASESTSEDVYISAQADLSTLNKLIEEIDNLLEKKEKLTSENVDFVDEILGSLKERINKYTK